MNMEPNDDPSAGGKAAGERSDACGGRKGGASAPLAGLFATGLVSAVAQVAALREIGVSFNGSEIVIGSVLAAWFALSALGVAAGGKLAARPGIAPHLPPILFCVAALTLPGFMAAARLMPTASGLPGEAVGFPLALLASCLLLAPVCLPLGALFPALANAASGGNGEAPVRAYMTEAAGFLGGGLLVSFLFIPLLSQSIAVAASSFACFAAAAACLRKPAGLPAKALAGAAALALCAAAAAFSGHFDRWSRAFKHPGEAVLKTADTRFGVFTVTSAGGQTNFYCNGGLLWNSDDPARAEEIAHAALCSHPNPSNVLIVGGGPRGVLREALKHPVASVECVDIDPAPVTMGMEFLGRMDRSALDDKRASLVFGDARRRLRSLAPASLDVVIVDAPEPSTGFLNRFYTVEFFDEARRAMKEDGVFAIALQGTPGYAPDALRSLFGTVAASLNRAFGNAAAVRSDHAGWIFAAGGGLGGFNPEAMASRFHARSISSEFTGPRFFRTVFARKDAAVLLAESLADAEIEPNRDLKPLCYVMQFAFHDSMFAEAGGGTGRYSVLVVLGLAFAVVLVAFIRWAGMTGAAGPAVLFAVLAAGAASMTVEIALLLAFQAGFGYAWGYAGLFAAAFMLGTVLGSAAGMAHVRGSGGGIPKLCAAVSAFAVLSLASASAAGKVLGLPAPVSLAAFLALTAGAGFFTGIAFPFAVSAVRGSAARGASAVYAADLAGSAAGSAAATAVLIPSFGIAESAGAAAILLAAATVPLAVLSAFRARTQ